MRKASLYIPLHAEVYDHPKTWIVASVLSIDEAAVVGYLGSLWTWAKATLTVGTDLGRWPNVVVAKAARWKGDADRFVEALVSAGYLDRDGASLTIHDEELYADKLHAKRDLGDGKGAMTNAERCRMNREARKAAKSARPATDHTDHVATNISTTATMSRPENDHVATSDRPTTDMVATSLRPVENSTEQTRKEKKRGEVATMSRPATDTVATETTTHNPVAPMRWPTEPKPRALNRGVLGMQETSDKPAAEAAIRACLTSEGKDERLTGLLRDLGPDAGDALESLMGAWSRKYDMDGPQPALAGLKLWLREKTDKRKATDLHVEASKARAARNGLTVTTDGQVVTETHEVWEALARQDWRRFKDAGEDVPSELSEFKALHRAHYASGGSSLWDAHVEANLGDVVPDFAGLVKGKPVSKQVPDEARTLARRDYDGLTGMGVQPGQRWTDYWAEHKDHYERGGGSRWEAHMAALEATPEPQVIAPGARVGESPVVNLWSGEAQDGGAQ